MPAQGTQQRERRPHLLHWGRGSNVGSLPTTGYHLRSGTSFAHPTRVQREGQNLPTSMGLAPTLQLEGDNQAGLEMSVGPELCEGAREKKSSGDRGRKGL